MRRSAFLAALAAAPLPVLAAPRAIRLLVLGDSLALATGASRPDGGFIFPVFRALVAERPGSRLDSAAIGGSTVADVVRLQAGRIASTHPDVIILCVGGNDVVRETAADAFAHSYRDLIAAARRAAPPARIVCCGVPNVGTSPLFAGERHAVTARSAADDAAVRSAATHSGSRYVNFFSVTSRRLSDERFFSRDRFHPSDAGYALLRAAFEPVLRAAIDDGDVT